MTYAGRLAFCCILAAATALLPMLPARAETIKLGILTDFDGPYSDISGKGVVEAARMAVEEIANAALFLVSDEASYVSGVALPVDGARAA